MDLSLLCIDDQTRSPPALTDSQTEDLNPLSLLHSPTENMLSAYETGAEAVSDLSDPKDKSTEPLSNISKCLSEEKSTDSDSLKPPSSSFNMSECLSLCSEPAPQDDDFRVCSYSSEPVLPLLPRFSHDLISPLYGSFSEFKQEPALSFSSTPQPLGALSSTFENLTEPYMYVPEPLSSSEHGRATYLIRSLSRQSDSLESDTTIVPVPDLYISESDTQDFIQSPNVDPNEIQCPEYQPLSHTSGEKLDCDVLMCDSDTVVTQCHHSSSEERNVDHYESGVSQHAKPPAVDACEAGLMSVNDGRQGKAEVADSTPQTRRSDSPIELWLDACQYLAGEDTEDLLDKIGQSVTQAGHISDLSFPPGETQVSGYNPDGSEVIGWSEDDTGGWGPPVERWSSVDSWESALSDWTDIIAAPPEDFTAAFTEIGAEIDALTQALAEVNTQIDTETSKEGQSQSPMGVQDQPLEAQSIPESSVLSGQSPLSLGPELRNREGSQSVESLCDSTTTTQEEKEPEEIQSSQAECSPCSTRQDSSGATVASPGGYSVDVMPGSSADLDLSHFGGFVGSDIFIGNEEEPIILNIIEDTDLEGQNTPGELTIEEVR